MESHSKDDLTAEAIFFLTFPFKHLLIQAQLFLVVMC